MFFYLFFLFFSSNSFSLESNKIELISSVKHVEPEKTFLLALQFQLEKDWHTYWSYPGDIGQAPHFKWNLPKELKVQPLPWPLPDRHVDSIGERSLYSYIYKKELTLLFEARLDQTYSQFELPIKLDLDWAVCKDVCISKKSSFETYLQVSNKVKESQHAKKLIEQKKIIEQKKLTASFKRKKLSLIISFPQLNLGECLDIFPKGSENFKNFPAISMPNETCSFSVAASSTILPQVSGILIHKKNSRILSSEFTAKEEGLLTLFWQALFAFLGGLILNIMPCVLPIIFLKLFNTLEVIKTNPKKMLLLNLSYASGVIFSFLTLAFAVLLIKSAGKSVGWGFHLQSPIFILFLIFLFIAMGLLLLDKLKLPLPKTKINFKENKVLSHFMTGVLSTTAASPCTVPFMASSVGFALSRSYIEVFTIFFFIGFGLSFPYLFISFFPKVFENISFPTTKLNRIKKIFSIPLFLTAIWLAYLLSLQWQPVQSSSPFKDWRTFNLESVERAQEEDKNIFIAFGAKWCLTCLSNEQTLKSKEVLDFFKKNKIELYYGDWTKGEHHITKFLQKYGREGVPFYIFFKGKSKTKIFSTFILPKSFIKEFKKTLNTNE